MRSYKEDNDTMSYSKVERRPVVKTRAAWFGSILVSIAGGLLLGWWEYVYHPSYSQLWMVPFGLILFATPVIVWFSLVVSQLCINKEDGDCGTTRVSQPLYLPSSSVSAKNEEQWNNHLDHA